MTTPSSAFTIDGPGSRDLDDALWVERLDGAIRLHVYVADPTSAVEPGSAADIRAAEMLETRYYATGNDPMLPRHISEGESSLLPGQLRSALHARITYGGDGSVVDKELRSGAVVRSVAKLHYGMVPEILGLPTHALHDLVGTLRDLAQALLARRRSQGALALYDLRSGLLTREEGTLRHTDPDQETLGQVIVQEAMIAANAFVAELCVQNNLPILFRNHEPLDSAPPRAQLQQWLADMTSVPRQVADHRAKVLDGVLGRARYGSQIRGHFGLSLAAYAHCTSPLRRYADLVNHRQVLAHLTGRPLPYSRQDLAVLAERINHYRDQAQQGKSQRFKEKADQLLARRAASDMALLEPKAFSRVIKLATRAGDPHPHLVGEVGRRSADASLQVADAYHILWCDPATGWAPAMRFVAAFLAANPAAAVSVAAMSATLAPSSPATVADAEPSEFGGFTSSAAGWGLGVTGSGPTKKAATQRAAARLFCLRAGLDLADPPSSATPAPAKARRRPPLPSPDSLNPVSELQLYCQALPAELPTYEFYEAPRSGALLFRCTVSAHLEGLDIRCTSGNQPSKRDAKRDCAAAAILEIRRLARDP